MPRESLGHFEQLVLLAILRLEGEAYGVPIVEEIRRRSDRRRVAPAAVYVALRRLEEKGLIRSWPEDAKNAPRGKPRRFVALTPEAVEQLKADWGALRRMGEGLESILEES